MVPFDLDRYRKLQTDAILSRLRQFSSGKLYFEIGGKFLFDEHAERVLPGFDPLTKIDIIQGLGKKFDIILAISSKDIEENRMWKPGADYEHSLMNLLTNIKLFKLPKPKIAVNLYQDKPATNKIVHRLAYLGYEVYKRFAIPDYPHNLDLIVSDAGFGRDEYIPSEHKLVLVVSLGSNSGKMSTCLGQIYHDAKRKQDSGFAKYELFPIWNLPLKHPVNLAYEAATADVGDYNVYDEFYFKQTGKQAVNYNRDVEAFPILQKLIDKIVSPYNQMRAYTSPTAMGISSAGDAIADMDEIIKAAISEIKFRANQYSRMKDLDAPKWVAKCKQLLAEAEQAYPSN